MLTLNIRAFFMRKIKVEEKEINHPNLKEEEIRHAVI